MDINVLAVAYTSNAIGVLLILTLMMSNGIRMSEKDEIRYIFRILVVDLIACIADCVTYATDGLPGISNTILIYLSNSWLYFANVLTGVCWVRFICEHLNLTISKRHELFLKCLIAISSLCLIINLFVPVVFSVNNNVYDRSYLYFIYMLIAGVCMADTVLMYLRARKTGGHLKFLPIASFLIPVVVGVSVQTLFYGISVIWVSVAIAMAGVMTALKNEVIFLDRLTGIYNRSYLDRINSMINDKKNACITGIMIDLNDFKSINDNYGHTEGDEALITAANIFRKAVGGYGNVLRYAGDEFVIILNTSDEDITQKVINTISSEFEKYNKADKKPYKLSASMGYATLNMKTQTMNDFLNTIDAKMYSNKAEYYKKSGKDRRQR